MKEWLLNNEKKQLSLFNDLMNYTMNELNQFNVDNNKDVSVRVIFEKDNWLDGKVELQILKYRGEDDYDIVSTHTHNVYDVNSKGAKNIMAQLMRTGLFTNSWFNILDKSRTYDATILFTPKKFFLENDNCEYRETAFNKSHLGFNEPEVVKNKMKIK